MEQTNRGLERKRYESDKDYNKRIMQHNRILQVEIIYADTRDLVMEIANKFLSTLDPNQVKKIKLTSDRRFWIVYITYYKNKE